MSASIIKEWHFWLVSIAAGTAMAFVYDLLRLFRRLVRHGRLWVDAEDLLFWAACFFASFTLLYYGNNGVIRFAAVFGAGIGMLFYELTLGRIFVKYSTLFINRLFAPIIGFIKKIAKKISLFARIRLTKLKNRLKIICKSILKKKEKDREGENANAEDVKSIKKERKKAKRQKKDARVSPRPK